MYWKELLSNPEKAIRKVMKEKKFNNIVNLLVLEWILIGLASFATLYQSYDVQTLGLATISLIFLGIIGTLGASLLVAITFSVLGGRGKYFHALASTTLGLFAPSLAFLVAALFSLAGISGVVVGFLVVLFLGLLGIATFVRSIKEMYKVDYITVWIGISILGLSVAVALYASAVFGIVQIPELSKLSQAFQLPQTLTLP